MQVYCRKLTINSKTYLLLKEKANYDCIFLTKDGCRHYPIKPIQCTTYPFWKNFLENKKNWLEEEKNCPGIGKGKRISKNRIEEFLKEAEEIELVCW